MKKKVVIDCICGVLILLFAYTSFSKLLGYVDFVKALQQSPIIRNEAIAVSILVPFAELAIVVLLFLPTTRSLALFCSVLLIGLFTSYIGTLLLTKSRLPCTCGGVLKSLSWKNHLLFNILFLIVAIAGYYLEKSKNKKWKTEDTSV